MAAFLAVVAILEMIFGVGEFTFAPSVMQMIVGLIAFGFGVLTIATVWGFWQIHARWEKHWAVEETLTELAAAPNRGRYTPE